jgi:hypothetical protein
MKKIKIYLVFILAIILIYFGRQVYDKLDTDPIKLSLKMAGENKMELKRVLDYYNKDEDSLKLKAAKILIANMTYHYSSSSFNPKNDCYLKAFKLVDSTAKNHFLHELQLKPMVQNYWKKTKSIKENLLSTIKKQTLINNVNTFSLDVKTIKSEWLISHIESSFNSWNNSKLFSSIDFSEFSMTMLPYRYDKEMLNMPTGYSNSFLKTELFKKSNLNDTKTVINSLNFYFKKVNSITKMIDFKYDLGFYNLLKWGKLECDDQTPIAAKILNDIGIPTHIDCTPQWLNRDARHSWCSSKESTGLYSPFSPGWQSILPSENKGLFNENFYKRTSKVYRKTYRYELISPYFLKKENEVVPPFFNTPYLKDVSDKYHKTSTLIMPTAKLFNRELINIAYLAIFSPRGWVAVGWGKVDSKNKHIIFEKVPLNVVYTIGVYKQNKIIPISIPFYFNKKRHNITPDYNNKITLDLTRKYPQKELLIDFRKKLINAKFQGANKKDFSDAVDLFQFDSIPKEYVTEIPINNGNSYKYVRFISSENWMENSRVINMAIMEYYSKIIKNEIAIEGTKPYIINKRDTLSPNCKELTKLEGTLICNNERILKKDLLSGFDGNMETFSKLRWAGIEFTRPRKIVSIRYAARNANNMINVGDTYELFYFDNDWKSMGKLKADNNYLTFKNVPSKTIYWLRNLNKGKEELSFFYINGEQIFINNDELSDYF